MELGLQDQPVQLGLLDLELVQVGRALPELRELPVRLERQELTVQLAAMDRLAQPVQLVQQVQMDLMAALELLALPVLPGTTAQMV